MTAPTEEKRDEGQRDRGVIEEVLARLLGDILQAPRRADLRHKAALCQILLKDRQGARRQLEAAIAENARYLDARRALAFLELAEKRYEEGAALMKKLREDFPGDWRASTAVGLYHGTAAKWGFARPALEEAIAAAPGRPLPLYALIMVLEELGEGGAALRAEADAKFPDIGPGGRDPQIFGNPGRGVAFREAARHVAKKGDPQAGFRFANLAFSLDLDLALHSLTGGDLGLEQGDVPEAVRCYRRAVEQDPELIPAKLALARALVLAGDVEGACAQVDDAIRLRPDFPDLHFLLGTIFLERGEAAKATAEFEAALERNPRYATAGLALGQARLARGDAAGAERAFAAARAAGMKSEDLASGLGFARLGTGNLEGAVEGFKEAMALDETLPGPHLGLALVAERRGDLAAARRHLEDYDVREHDLSASDEAIALRKRLGASDWKENS